jgi:hypothetical protein
MRHHTRRLTRRDVLATGAASVAALAGCNGLGLDSSFEFPDGEPSDEQKGIARTFVERVHDGAYEAATGPFTSDMTDAMSSEQLESDWDQNVGDLGDYEEISRWGVIAGENTDAVFARVECENGYYVLQVTIRGQQIAGLFFKDRGTE